MARTETVYQFVGTQGQESAPQRLDRAVAAWARALARAGLDAEDRPGIADRGPAGVVE